MRKITSKSICILSVLLQILISCKNHNDVLYLEKCGMILPISQDYLDNGITDPDPAEDYFSAMSCVSVIQTNDWGIFNIITDEMASYSQGKSIEEIAESLQSRLNLYIDENYS